MGTRHEQIPSLEKENGADRSAGYIDEQTLVPVSADRAMNSATRTKCRRIMLSQSKPLICTELSACPPFQEALSSPSRKTERSKRELPQIRGILADQVFVSIPLDPYLFLRALSTYASLSVRRLRVLLEDLSHQLSCFRIGGKLLVKRSDFYLVPGIFDES